MFRINENKSEAYWKSYRLLEDELIRLSHSIAFDDEQINVYSTELADIINSACVKIESLSKDIYENHILQFQLDNNLIPSTYRGKNFDLKKWTRDSWKYDHNCLVEIDRKYNISKKKITLKLERFNFHKYGSSILPFYNINNDCKGGKWEFYSHKTFEAPTAKRFEDIDWCKSYQQIKHNYIESLKKHANIKNAIMTLSAFYVLLVYNTCLPFKQFDLDSKTRNSEIDFDSKIFSCDMCNFTRPMFIIDSEYEKHLQEMKIARETDPLKEVFVEQEILDGYDSCMFLITLNNERYLEVKKLVNEYCKLKNVSSFDVAPYKNEAIHESDIEGKLIYDQICKITKVPYFVKDVKVTFNLGIENIYEDYNLTNDYEKLKHKNRNNKTLTDLKVGDFVNIKLYFNDIFDNCEVKKLTKDVIYLEVKNDKKSYKYSAPLSNIIYIEKNRKDD